VVRAEHHACGHETRVRLPGHVSPAAVRRVVCHSCAQAFEAPAVEEVELVAPQPQAATVRRRLPRLPTLSAPSRPNLPKLPSAPPLPEWLHDPRSRVWRLASIPVAVIAVIAGLILLQGGSEDSDTPFAGTAPAVTDDAGPAREGGGKRGDASFVRESSFSLALPAGWERTNPSGGATFGAAAESGDADATLWVEQDPKLTFQEFESTSLEALEALAGSARVVERVAAPTPEGTIVRLAADNPPGATAYQVTLRGSGDYWYYLATTVQPDASSEAVEGAELINGSLVPSGAEK